MSGGDPTMAGTQKTEFRDYRIEPNFPPFVIYTRQHAEMTVDGVRNSIDRYEAAFRNGDEIKPGTRLKDIDQEKLASRGAVVPMSMWQIFNLLRFTFDATDPDNFWGAQDLHSIQVGTVGGQPQNREAQMLRLFGFIHDISKGILSIDMADQLVVGGDIFPLGVYPRQVIGRGEKDMVPYADYGFKENADWRNGVYPRDPTDPDYEYGIYSEFVKNGDMSLDRLIMLFQHDKHLRIILDHLDENDHHVPEDWMKVFKFLATHHSFHALHDFDTLEDVKSGPFYWTTNADDRAMLASGIVEKNKFRDLYTKTDLKIGSVVVDEDTYRRAHYPVVQQMLDEYFPKPILVPVTSNRLPRFLRLMETSDLVETLGLISPAVQFVQGGGVVFAASETEKPLKGELINGFLELLRVKGVNEKDPDLSRDLSRVVKEIACALPNADQFCGMGKPIKEVLTDFDATSRSLDLTHAIAKAASAFPARVEPGAAPNCN
jgi:hypothetical protein